jgi:hypothetical protein
MSQVITTSTPLNFTYVPTIIRSAQCTLFWVQGNPDHVTTLSIMRTKTVKLKILHPDSENV